MQFTVFGASGGVGAHVVALAAQRGHQVRAVYRTTPQPPPPQRTEVLLASGVFDHAVAARAIRGADVVVTAIGPNFATRHNPRTAMTSPPDLHQRLARTLVAAMKESAATARLIAVSTASMGPADHAMGIGPRLLFRFFRTVVVPNLGHVGQDLKAMETELAASGLDWYALRPVKLTDGPLTGHVQVSDRVTLRSISRADVAWHIVALAEDVAPHLQRTPVVTAGAGSKSRPSPAVTATAALPVSGRFAGPALRRRPAATGPALRGRSAATGPALRGRSAAALPPRGGGGPACGTGRPARRAGGPARRSGTA